MNKSSCVNDSVNNFGVVSIVMPNYNGEKYLSETLESIMLQTYPFWELLFVDDCSTDRSVEIVESYHDDRIKIFKNDVNSGAATSRNRALREAKGKWIAFLDSDDLWEPDKLLTQLNFMIKGRYSFSYTRYSQIDSESEPLNIEIFGPKLVTKKKMFRYAYVGCLTVMYNAETVGLIQVEPTLKSRNDYAIWLKVCKKADCYLLDQSLAKYRIRKDSLSHSGFSKSLINQYKLFRFGEKMGVVRSLYHTAVNLFFGFWKKIIYVKKVK